MLGVRGPFGTGWPVAEAAGADVVVVAGGIGLAPLRPASCCTCSSGAADYGERRAALRRAHAGRSPLSRRARRAGGAAAAVDVTVDAADADWHGKVGVVPKLVPRARFDAASAAAFVCGPEIMMRFAVQALLDARRRGRSGSHVSLERNMHCGVGHCGHCQLGPTLICRDGPVYRYGTAAPWLRGAGAVSGAGRSSPSGSSPPATAASSRCSTARTSCSRSPGEVEIAYFLEASSADGRGAVRPLARRGLDHDAARRRADPGGAPRLEGARHDRRLRDRGRHPGAAQLRRRRGVHAPSSTPRPNYISTLATSTPISAHVPVDFELRGCPIDKRQLLEVVTAFLHGRRPGHPVDAASAPSASAAAPSASWSRTGRPASGRSRTPAAARSAPPTTAAATAASGRWRRRTPSR